ncbi:DUF892 family protein [Foetidibacter luteolus]|uniref:DUF892 family protein n=1 Tax=Foetidibacter luteolus TaxID=2608880 RepID=UPI001A997F4E
MLLYHISIVSAKKAFPQQCQPKAFLGRDFCTDELKDNSPAEKHITKALPKMPRAATSEELVGCFEEHL